MASSGREEAGIYLIGLLGRYASDLGRLELIAEQIAHFPDKSSANALFAELRRVRSSNTTRRYLDRVLRSLVYLPSEFVRPGLEELADDAGFSYKMRAKFREYCDQI
jgi:hypothetical protein